jgi:hypothetical protein
MTAEQFAVDREFVRQQRELLARIVKRFPVIAMATTPKDVTQQSNKMPRESCLLYRNKDPRGADACHYRGIMRDSDGRDYWVALWVRVVKGQRVLEIRRVLKTN